MGPFQPGGVSGTHATRPAQAGFAQSGVPQPPELDEDALDDEDEAALDDDAALDDEDEAACDDEDACDDEEGPPVLDEVADAPPLPVAVEAA